MQQDVTKKTSHIPSHTYYDLLCHIVFYYIHLHPICLTMSVLLRNAVMPLYKVLCPDPPQSYIIAHCSVEEKYGQLRCRFCHFIVEVV